MDFNFSKKMPQSLDLLWVRIWKTEFAEPFEYNKILENTRNLILTYVVKFPK